MLRVGMSRVASAIVVALFVAACSERVDAPTDTPAPEVTLPDDVLGDATVGAAFSHQLKAEAGTPPYSFAATGLPAGLAVDAAGKISGTPTAAGDATLSVTVTDSKSKTATKDLPMKVFEAVAFKTDKLPDGIVGLAYSQKVVLAGGKAPVAVTVASGTVPGGLEVKADGSISGTPAAAGAFNFTLEAKDANGAATQKAFDIAVNAKLAVTTAALAQGEVNLAYTDTVKATGGKAPLAFSATGLPDGLTLEAATGKLLGTPTVDGAFPAEITVSDAFDTKANATLSITIHKAVRLTNTALADGYVGENYTATLTAADGKAPYTFKLAAGASLPAGLALDPSGAIAGTPGSAGTATVSFVVTDALGATATRLLPLNVVTAPAISTTSVPDGYVGTPYAQAFSATGGKAPYTWSLASGTEPAGLLFASTGDLAGTPSADGSATLGVKVTDANGHTATRNVVVRVFLPPTVGPSTLSEAYSGTFFTAALTVTGGKAPIVWSSTGNVPAGLTLNDNVLSGTPTTAGTYNFTVKATDANTVVGSKGYTMFVRSPPQITTTSLPDAYVGGSYLQTIDVTGGKTPYAWAVSSGSLPADITLDPSSGTLSGTPSAGTTANFTVKVTDANGMFVTKPLSLAVRTGLGISTASLPDAYAGSAYGPITLAAAGGKAPFTWAVTAGGLPTGINLNATTGVVSGTAPSQATTATVTFTVTDANGTTADRQLTLAVLALPAVTTSSLADTYAGTSFGATLAASGGKGPYTFKFSGTAPAGWTLTTQGDLTGSPTVAGAVSFSVIATDANLVDSAAKSLTLNVYALPVMASTTPSEPYVGTAYSHTFATTGGKPTLAWTLQSGAFPAGLTLNGSTGTLSGNPTTVATSTFTVRATDGNGKFDEKSFTVQTRDALLIGTSSPLAQAYVDVPYSATMAASGGKTPYTWSKDALPAGLTLDTSTGVVSGTPTAAGTTSFSLSVRDANGISVSKPMSILVNDRPSITTAGALADAYVGDNFSLTLAATGGKPGYAWSITSGNPPAGTTLNNGVLSGTLTASGAYSFVVTVTDQNSLTATKTVSGNVYSKPSLATPAFADAYVGRSFSGTLSASGGKLPYAYSIVGSAPGGITIDAASGVLSGSPTAAGTFNFAIQVKDANQQAASVNTAIQVYDVPSISNTALTDGYIGQAYSDTVAATGGKGTLSFSMTGTLPGGVTFNASTGVISGTPQSPTGSANLTFTVKDANNVSASKTLSLATWTLPTFPAITFTDGYVGSSYNVTAAATGGKPNLAYSIVPGGSLPAGVTLNASSGAIAGLPTTAGTSTFTIEVKDANNKTATVGGSIAIYDALALTTSALADAYTGSAYAVTLAKSGGKASFTWSVTPALPAGLTLDPSSGAITGTPSAATASATYTFQVKDANNRTATAAIPFAVYDPLVIPAVTFGDGYVGAAYSVSAAATGGKPNVAYSITTGALPAGVTLNASTGLVSGTPTTAGSSSFTIQAKDANNKTATVSGSIVVYDALALTTTALADGYAGASYGVTLAKSGGKANFTWSVTPALPAGLTLDPATGAIAGTPSAATASATYTFQVKDANNKIATAAIPFAVYDPLVIPAVTFGDGYVGTAYSVSAAATGGKPSVAYSITSGSLPAGLTLGATTGLVSGTPTTAGSSSFTIQAKDANNKTASVSATVAVYGAVAITTTALPDAYLTEAYSRTLASAGGKGTLTWTMTGTPPAGITFDPATATLSGTPTAVTATVSLTFQVKDANNVTATKTLSFGAYALPAWGQNGPADPYAGVAYSFDVSTLVTGGKAPLNYTVETGYSLPPGLTLAATTGVLSGTPTTAGITDVRVRVTDANGRFATTGGPMEVFAKPAITTAALPDAYLTEAYSRTLASAGGKGTLTWTMTGTPPAGITFDPATATLSGTPTAATATVSLTFQVKDANNVTATKTLSFGAYALPAWGQSGPTDPYAGVAYSFDVSTLVTGGKAPLNFTVETGYSLPPGLTLAPTTGVLSGTPTTAGITDVRVRVTDANGRFASTGGQMEVFAKPAISTTALADGYVGEAYNQVLARTGGKAPYTWSVSGTLPAGLSLDVNTGNLVGTPSATVASTPLTFTVSDANGVQGTKQLSIAVYALPKITGPATVPLATEGVYYSVPVTITGGKPTLTFSASGLPAGLTFDSATRTIAGYPGQGTATTTPLTVNLVATDSNARSATISWSLTVEAPKPLLGGGAAYGPVRDQLTVFVTDYNDQPRVGVAVRIRKNGVEFGSPKEALTSSAGRVNFSGISANGTTDRVDVTVNGKDVRTSSFLGFGSQVVTVNVESLPTPLPRRYQASLYDTTTGKLVIFGGQGSANGDGGERIDAFSKETTVYSDLVQLDTPATATWSIASTPGMKTSPNGVKGGALLLVGGKYMLFGGDRGLDNGGLTNEIWTFDPATKAWKKEAFVMPAPMAYHSMAVTPTGQIYLFGGLVSTGTPPSTQASSMLYQFVNGTFQQLFSFGGQPTPRYGAALAFLPMSSQGPAGSLLVYGGTFDGTTALNDTWVCDLANGGSVFWSQNAGLPDGMGRHGAALATESSATALLFGGQQLGTSPTGVYRYDYNIRAWSSVIGATPSRDLPSPRTYMSWAKASGSVFYMYGGGDPGGFVNGETWSFDASTGQWTRLSPLPTVNSQSQFATITGNVTGMRAQVAGQTSNAEIWGIGKKGNRVGARPGSTGGVTSYAMAVPAADTYRLYAVEVDYAASSPSTRLVNFVDLGEVTITTQNSTTAKDVAFPATPPAKSSMTGSLTLPAGWTTVTFGGAYMYAGLTGYPSYSLQSGLTDFAAATRTYSGAWFPLPGATQQLGVNAVSMTDCQAAQAYYDNVTAGTFNVTLPAGPSALSPGLSQCATGTVPTAAETVAKAFTAPAGTTVISVDMGPAGYTTEWSLIGNGTAGAQSVTFPLQSSLAPQRATPSGQKVIWRPRAIGIAGGLDLSGDISFRTTAMKQMTQVGAMRYERQ